jgi:hypothetical protein
LITAGVESRPFAIETYTLEPSDQELQPSKAPEPSPGSEPVSDVAQDKTAPADSSPAKDEDKKTLLDAVRSAIDVKNIDDEDAPISTKSKADPSTAEGDKSQPDDKSKPDSKDDVSDDALLAALDQLKADVPLNKIERFREVVQENRQLKGANERYRAIDQTLTDIGNDARVVGLSNDDVAQLFAWPRLLARDPTAAVEQLQAFASQWQEKVGKTLPEDIKKKVDDGLLDEDTAKEVAQLRATSELAKTRGEAERVDREQKGREQALNDIRAAVDRYQGELRTSDPDYTPEKHAMTVDALTALVATRGVPASVQDAVAMAKEAYTTVTKRLSAFKPQPRQVASPSIGRRMNKPAESQPKTMQEAVLQALGE